MMRKLRGRVKRGKRVMLYAIMLIVLSIVGMDIHTSAVQGSTLQIQIDEVTPSSVSYSINSDVTYEDALLIVTVHDKEDNLVDCTAEVQTIERGMHSVRQVFASARFDNAKVFLLDSKTWIPLCTSGELIHHVTFVDYDGTLLSAQEVAHRQAATAPENPSRTGYSFTGWDKNYQDIQEDLVITACYVEESVENIFSVSSASGSVGDEITVRVSLSGNVLLSGFDIQLLYDDNILEYVSTDSELSMDILDQHITEDHYIIFNYLSAGGNRTTGGAISDITFRIKNKNKTTADLHLLSNSVVYVASEYGGNPVPTAYSLKDGVVTIR